MGNILKITEGIRDFNGPKFRPIMCPKTTKNQKISNPFCDFQDNPFIYSLAKN